MKNPIGLSVRQHAFALSRRIPARPFVLDDGDESHDDAGSAAPGGLSPKDAAEYIESMSLQLHDMAVSSELTFLSYLLRLVAEEAKLACDQPEH